MKLRLIHISVSLYPVRALACSSVPAVGAVGLSQQLVRHGVLERSVSVEGIYYERHLFKVGDDKNGRIYFRRISANK